MINCRVCKKAVAKTAEVCPHCGVKRPDMGAYKQTSGGQAFGVLALAAMVLYFAFSTDGVARWAGFALGGFLALGGLYGVHVAITGKET